ncbi:unnamed protein product, partial [Lampetra fluviatilis]
CYPHCPAHAPYLDENAMRCVRQEQCSCLLAGLRVPAGGSVVPAGSCEVCVYAPGAVISTEVDQLGLCTFTTVCPVAGGAVEQSAVCKETTTVTVVTTASTTATTATTAAVESVIVPRTEGVVLVTRPGKSTPQAGGEVLYNTTQRDGTCRVAICKPDCSGVEAMVLGERWNTTDCMVATCTGPGPQVTMVKRPCSPLPAPVCDSGRKAVRVDDADGCCYRWECDCLCTGFGDPHMRTFDGAAYTLLNPCSYVLLQEKRKTYDLSISADYFDCNDRQNVSCPRTLIIVYKGNELRVGLASEVNFALRKIQLKGQTRKAPFTDKGFQVSSVKTDDFVVIPDIRVKIQFNGLGFLIDVPRELFGDNTEGQCGTCNNRRGDDCAGRDGAARSADCCTRAAQDWLIADASKPLCAKAVPLPPGTGCKAPVVVPVPVVPERTCADAKICDGLILQTFSACASVVELAPFRAGCAFDHCVVNRSAVDCSSAQAAAAECGRAGACVDWRPRAAGRCRNMIYKPCETKISTVCGMDRKNFWVGEGCFCPDGAKLLELGSSTCVGDSWLEGCEQKECLEGGRVLTSAVPCEDEVASSRCPSGVRLVPAPPAPLLPGASVREPPCCPALQCDACVHNGVYHQVGERWNDTANRCVLYSCGLVGGRAAMQEAITSCAPFNFDHCE